MSGLDREPLPQPARQQQAGIGFLARKDGAVIAALRAVQQGDQCVVEASVVRDGQPRLAGPYRFPTVADARAFVSEAGEALTYLGCELDAPS